MRSSRSRACWYQISSIQFLHTRKCKTHRIKHYRKDAASVKSHEITSVKNQTFGLKWNFFKLFTSFEVFSHLAINLPYIFPVVNWNIQRTQSIRQISQLLFSVSQQQISQLLFSEFWVHGFHSYYLTFLPFYVRRQHNKYSTKWFNICFGSDNVGLFWSKNSNIFWLHSSCYIEQMKIYERNILMITIQRTR